MSDAGAGVSPSEGLSGWIRRWIIHRRDDGVGQVLEAMLIGVMVMGAIGFAVAFSAPPPPSSTAGSENLGQTTWDAVQALDKMYYPDASFGDSVLSKVVADAAAGNSEPLADSISRFMPTGAAYQVYLNNGYDRIPLYTNQTPSGQTVGIAYPFEPDWKYHYSATDLRIYNANSTLPAMGLNTIPLLNSNHVEDEGQFVRAQFGGEQGWLPGRSPDEVNTTCASDPSCHPLGENSSVNVIQKSFVEDAYTTLLQGNETRSYPSASIYMECKRNTDGDKNDGNDGESQPCYAMDFTGQMDGYGPVDTANKSLPGQVGSGNGTWHRVDIVVDNDGEGTVPAGTTLTVRYPSGLPVKKSLINTTGDIGNVSTSGDADGPMTVQATVEGDGLSTGETAELITWVHVNDQRFAYKRIDAYLADGAASQSQFLTVVAKKSWGPETGGDTRVALVSAPKPMGSVQDDGALPTGRWGLVLTTPVGPVDIEEVTLNITEGKGRFANASFPDDFAPTYTGFLSDSKAVTDGTIKVDSDEIRWKGEHRADGYTFAELQFEVTGDGTDSPAAPDFPLARPDAQFSGYAPPPQSVQIEPGIWWSEYPPETSSLDGYGATTGSTSSEKPIASGEIDLSLEHRNTFINGTETYYVADLGAGNAQGAVKDAATASRLTNTPQRVEPGENVNFTLRMDDLATHLAEEGGINSLQMETNIYAPWGIRDLTPVETYKHHTSAGVLDAPTFLTPAYLNSDNVQDVLAGSTDGTLYGMDGASGKTLAGKSFSLPAEDIPEDPEDASSPAQPNILTRSMSDSGPMYGLGTQSGVNKWYSLDETIHERWAANKPFSAVATTALNNSLDLTGDGIPEYVVAHATNTTGNAESQIEVFNGKDIDADGIGDLLPGWSGANTKKVTGTTEHVGMGYFGATAEPGVYATSGIKVESSAEYNIDTTMEAVQDQDADGAENMTIAAGVAGTGLVGFYEDGRRAWNFSSGDFTHLMTADKMDTGGAWSGIIGADQDGWILGMNGSQPIQPVDGYTYGNIGNMTSVAMSNAFEGYIAAPDGQLFATRDGWTSVTHYDNPHAGSAVPEITYPGVRAVDTPDGGPWSGVGNVSWWAGDNGIMLRSDDHLGTIDEMSLTARLVGIASLRETQSHIQVATDFSSLSKDEVTLSKINFKDVHAVSPSEAWFIGHGIDDTDLEEYTYIVHATNKGQNLDILRVQCGDECKLNAIASDGERLWVVGHYGIVMVHQLEGTADHVTLDGSPGVNDKGILALNLTTDKAAEIDDVTVDWDTLGLDWARGVTLNDADGNPDLWNKTDGGDHIEGPKLTTYDEDYGAADNATMHVRSYTNNASASAASDRTFNGSAQLMVGPFRPTVDPSPLEPPLLTDSGDYYPQSWYQDSNNLPLKFAVNVTYGDGSETMWWVTLKEDGTVTTKDSVVTSWKTPASAGFNTSLTCFGMPDTDCAPYHDINFTSNHPDGLGGIIVGGSDYPSWPVVRMAPGTSNWVPAINAPTDQTFRGAAISMGDEDRWVAVGDNARVVQSFDAGENWTDQITPATVGIGPTDTLYGVDFTTPHTATIIGGSPALMYTLNGYREYGRTETNTLTAEPGSVSGAMANVTIDVSDIVISETNSGNALVTVDIWDNATKKWAQVRDPLKGWNAVDSVDDTTANYNFSDNSSTDEIKLRFTLRSGGSTQGFARWSPQIRGQLTVHGYTDGAPDGGDSTYKLDLNDTAAFDDLGQVDHSDTQGYLRLPPAQNPWVKKLGNPDEGDFSDTNTAFTGPRPTAMTLSPDGETLFVGTGAIYNVRTDTKATTDGRTAFDNTLYAMNVTTGEQIANWTLPHFEAPIQQIAVTDASIWVMTREPTEPDGDSDNTPDLWTYRLDRETGREEHLEQITSESVSDQFMVAMDAFKNSTAADLAIGHTDLTGESGVVTGWMAPGIDKIWSRVPAFNGSVSFTYETPRSSLYGAYITVSELTWSVTEENGEDLVQTARVHNSFSVTPPNKRPPLSPTYTLEVVAWMEDWG